MKYALVNGARQEPEPKLQGACPNCEKEMIAKCGQKRIWHWAHRGKLECDRWWEPETEWHRAWKSLFPKEWQEVIHKADDGERHIADVKNSNGLVIELQHSHISPEERLSRESFYENMVWVVDGMRLKRDLAAFRKAVDFSARERDAQNQLLLVPTADRAEILRCWSPIRCSVFLDFGDEEFSIGGIQLPPVLWRLYLLRGSGRVAFSPVTRANFLQFALNGTALQPALRMPPPPPRGRYRAGTTRRF